jgi:hypothetical protein
MTDNQYISIDPNIALRAFRFTRKAPIAYKK